VELSLVLGLDGGFHFEHYVDLGLDKQIRHLTWRIRNSFT